MQLTIIPSDNVVYVNGVTYSPLDMDAVPENVHALQWFDVSGVIEYSDGTPNEDITTLPAWATICVQKWEAADYEYKNPPQLTATAEQNKSTALDLLSQTDWAALPDVADPLKSSPYLANASEFNTYRNAVRQIVLNPVAGDITWPTLPEEQWVTAN